MWLLEALLALLMIPAVLGVPLYLAVMLGMSLSYGPTPLAVSAGVALATWCGLTLQLVLLPMLHCLEGCARDGELAIAWAGYVVVAASLALAIWCHQRIAHRPNPRSASGMHAER